MGKHKHAAVIHAWADGAQVQMKWESSGWQDSTEPAWFPELEYRIKPAEKVVRWLWAYCSVIRDRWATNRDYMTECEAHDYFGIHKKTYRKLEWSREEFNE